VERAQRRLALCSQRVSDLTSLVARAASQQANAGAALRLAEQAVASAAEAVSFAATAGEQSAHADTHSEAALRFAHQTTTAAESLTARTSEFAGLSSQQTETCGRASMEFADLLDNLRNFNSGGDLG
jgi:hypothetical protein